MAVRPKKQIAGRASISTVFESETEAQPLIYGCDHPRATET
jgi:hypothetical protein